MNSKGHSFTALKKSRETTEELSEAGSFKNVFVLCTGRCGSVTFSKACTHFANYSSGHESRTTLMGDDRLAFADHHIEVDNRLAWLLGRLDQRFGDEAFYVHLTRNEKEVAESYDQRWNNSCSLIQAFDEGILKHKSPHEQTGVELARTINENIRLFLRDKSHQMTIDITELNDLFPEFARKIGAIGDLDSAILEFKTRHNARLPVVENKSRRSTPTALRTTKIKELRQRLRALYWLSIPGLILFSPVLISLWTARRAIQNRWVAKWIGGRWTRRKKAVLNAYWAFQTAGLEAALKLLRNRGPKGSVDLFHALAAVDDEDWITSMNRWANTNQLPKINLQPGSQPRFNRWKFETPKVVDSPVKVSVIMPAFNAEATLEQAANSILNQTWRNLELLIVDDCSSDATAEIAEKISAKDDRVKVLRNTCNVGPYVSKNRALCSATGKFITGHDADDIAIPTRLADQLTPILQDPKCKATIGYMIRVDRDGQFAYPSRICSKSYDGIAKTAMISLLVERDLLVSKLGYWDSVRYGADSEMLNRVSCYLGSGLKDIRKPLMICLYAEGSLTNNEAYGVTLLQGLSPIRKRYHKCWHQWHRSTSKCNYYMPFSCEARPFEAPEPMLVPRNQINQIAQLAEMDHATEQKGETQVITAEYQLDQKTVESPLFRATGLPQTHPTEGHRRRA